MGSRKERQWTRSLVEFFVLLTKAKNKGLQKPGLVTDVLEYVRKQNKVNGREEDRIANNSLRFFNR